MSAVWLQLDAAEAETLEAAADYLAGFGRVFELVHDPRFPRSDLHEVIRTLRALHARATVTARAA